VDGRRLGVEPICAVLQVAPSTYYAARNRPPSRRAQRDAKLLPRLVELWKDNYEVYGSRSCGRPPGAQAWTSGATRPGG
jgi:putative transposase